MLGTQWDKVEMSWVTFLWKRTVAILHAAVSHKDLCKSQEQNRKV